MSEQFKNEFKARLADGSVFGNGKRIPQPDPLKSLDDLLLILYAVSELIEVEIEKTRPKWLTEEMANFVYEEYHIALSDNYDDSDARDEAATCEMISMTWPEIVIGYLRSTNEIDDAPEWDDDFLEKEVRGRFIPAEPYVWVCQSCKFGYDEVKERCPHCGSVPELAQG